MNRDVIKSALIRAVRSFLQVFLGVYLAGFIGTGVENGTLANLLDLSVLSKAAFAGVVAVLSLLHRAVLDPSPVPSLPDTEADAGAGVESDKL